MFYKRFVLSFIIIEFYLFSRSSKTDKTVVIVFHQALSSRIIFGFRGKLGNMLYVGSHYYVHNLFYIGFCSFDF
jgi:hypothetical protein